MLIDGTTHDFLQGADVNTSLSLALLTERELIASYKRNRVTVPRAIEHYSTVRTEA